MGFNPVKALKSGVAGIGGMLVGRALDKGRDKPATTAPASSSASADDVAREEERRRLLSRGLSPLTATSPLGDQTAANIGRKALLGV